MKIHTTFLLSVTILCFAACAVLKRGLYVAAGGAGGAVIGGPPGAAAGAAAVAVVTDQVDENAELRDGALTGEDAKNKEIERLRLALANRPVLEVATPTPFVPPWVRWAVYGFAAFIAWTKGHHILAFLKGKGFANLLNVVLPSWAQKLTKKAPVT